jgi:hypothetical protein
MEQPTRPFGGGHERKVPFGAYIRKTNPRADFGLPNDAGVDPQTMEVGAAKGRICSKSNPLLRPDAQGRLRLGDSIGFR